MDPVLYTSSLKKAKILVDDFTAKPVKRSHFTLTPRTPTATHAKPSVRLDKPASTLRKHTAAPSSAPAPAGRSPKSKRIGGILSRRRTAASSPFGRVDPPTFSIAKAQNAAPLTIDTVVKGNFESDYIDLKLKKNDPRSLHFEIHEDTVETDLYRCDISDGEKAVNSEAKKKIDEDDPNKENIPPPDAFGPSSLSVSGIDTIARPRRVEHADEMTEGPRMPMGELHAKDFYANGCDASSYVIVPADGADEKLKGVPPSVEAECNVPSSCPPNDI